jgi:hypothetical protein
MKTTKKYIAALLVTVLLVSYPFWVPLSYAETKKSDNGEYVASITVHRVGALGLFNRFVRHQYQPIEAIK